MHENGYTQQQAADHLGRSLSVIGRWVAAERQLTHKPDSTGKKTVLPLADQAQLTWLRKESERLRVEHRSGPILRQVVAPDAVLCADGGASLKGVARQTGIAHRALNLSAGMRVLAGGIMHKTSMPMAVTSRSG